MKKDDYIPFMWAFHVPLITLNSFQNEIHKKL